MPETLEERIANLEAKVAELVQEKEAQELARKAQEDRDIALLARIDEFIEDLHRVERTQIKGFDSVLVQQNSIARRMDYVDASTGRLALAVNNHDGSLRDLVAAARDHKQAIDALAAGQRQILEILTGHKPPRND